MIRRTFNLFASIIAFALGSIYLFSDSASITANVIGASGSIAGFASIIGIVMIIGSIGLFMVTLHHIDDTPIDLEKLVKRSKASSSQESLAVEPIAVVPIKEVETHKTINHKKK
jgi:membrane associated rhomboid family serine protease